MDPESVKNAVNTSGAKRAFLYLVFGSPDSLHGSIKAMNEAGIEFVVFLSNCSIYTDCALRDIDLAQIIAYVHAMAEAKLDDAFGANHIAIRPGGFSSNSFCYRRGVLEGKVKVYGTYTVDNVTPEDIGAVSGFVLDSGPKNVQKLVYVYGPELWKIQDSFKAIGKALGKDLEISQVRPEEATEQYISNGIPPPMAQYLTKELGTPFELPRFEESVENVKIYTGRPATGFEDWLKVKKDELFT